MSNVPGPPNPFGQFDLAQMMQFLQVDGPVHWELARQMARWVAVGGTDEAALDRAEVARLVEIASAAEARALAGTGIQPAAGTIDPIGLGEAAERVLADMRPVLERLAVALQAGGGLSTADTGPFGGMLASLGPLLMGMQAGVMVGHLAQGLLSAHDLLLPTAGPVRPAVLVPNMSEFGEAWSIPGDDLRFYLALSEAVRSRLCARPWMRERFVSLASDYVSSFRVDPSAFEAQLGGLDLSDPASLERVMADPDALLGAMQTPEQLVTLERLQHTTAVLESYAEATVERLGGAMLPSLGLIREAIRRRRVERGEADRFLHRMLGVDPDRRLHQQAEAFCAGVIERAGDDGLDPLLAGEQFLPTPAELVAPGLWLARLETS